MSLQSDTDPKDQQKSFDPLAELDSDELELLSDGQLRRLREAHLERAARHETVAANALRVSQRRLSFCRFGDPDVPFV